MVLIFARSRAWRVLTLFSIVWMSMIAEGFIVACNRGGEVQEVPGDLVHHFFPLFSLFHPLDNDMILFREVVLVFHDIL